MEGDCLQRVIDMQRCRFIATSKIQSSAYLCLVYFVATTMHDSSILMVRRLRTSVRVARTCLLSVGAILMALSPHALSAQQAPPKCSDGVTIAGTVRNVDGQLVKNVAVHMTSMRPGADRETKTDADGQFLFSSIDGVSFHLRAQTAGMQSQNEEVTPLPGKCKLEVELRLQASQPPPPSGKASAPITQAMEFADQPNFTIAGVTDWTAVGGHGSDSTLRTTETLASETRSLKQQGADGARSDSAPRIGDKVASEAELRAAVDHAPTSFRANHELGIFYLNERRYADAIPLLESAYKIDPTNEANQYDLGRAYEGAGDLPRAREAGAGIPGDAEERGFASPGGRVR